MGNVGLSGLGARKKSRVLRTEPVGIVKIRKQEMEKQSTKDRGWKKAEKEEEKKKHIRKRNQGGRGWMITSIKCSRTSTKTKTGFLLVLQIMVFFVRFIF